MTDQVSVNSAVVSNTLRQLVFAGRRGTECVVLWLGTRETHGITVHEAYVPDQVAQRDVFRIPPPSMRKVLQRIDEKGWFIAAQVHSHPHEAFHSAADDRWAIVRHHDALSIVLPNFAVNANVNNFMTLAAVFRLDRQNKWLQVTGADLHQRIQIV